MFQMHFKDERSYDRSRQVQRIVLELIEDVNLELVTLWSVKIKRKIKQLPMEPAFCARIIGPGKEPEASVVLEHGVH
jgi:hypothetical protein